jgi:enoyl-CoA hydratase/carnithine racemase
MIRTKREGGIAYFILDRPQRKNAFDYAMARSLRDEIAAAQRDPAVRVLVIKGAADVFSTGRDLKAAAVEDANGLSFGSYHEIWSDVFHHLHRSGLPSVAVVRGYAVAGGFTLAMGCDFVLTERSAQFGAFEMRHGFPAAICTPILARLIGARLGLEFALFGDAIPAERLFAAGLINRLGADAEDLARIEADFVGRLAALDSSAVKATRDLFRVSENVPLDNALDAGCQLNKLIEVTGGFARAGHNLAKRD